MLSLAGRVRVFVAVAPVDFRRGIDGLYALVRDGFATDALSGDLFVFFNRAANRIKILTFDRNGFWLHLKRLERGSFERVSAADAQHGRVEIDCTHLALLLDGIELQSARSKKHFVAEIRLSKRDGNEDGSHAGAVDRDSCAPGAVG